MRGSPRHLRPAQRASTKARADVVSTGPAGTTAAAAPALEHARQSRAVAAPASAAAPRIAVGQPGWEPRMVAHPHPEPRTYPLMLRTWDYRWWKPVVGIVLLVVGVLRDADRCCCRCSPWPLRSRAGPGPTGTSSQAALSAGLRHAGLDAVPQPEPGLADPGVHGHRPVGPPDAAALAVLGAAGDAVEVLLHLLRPGHRRPDRLGDCELLPALDTRTTSAASPTSSPGRWSPRAS